MNSKEWYKREYGEDWWQIIYEQDKKEDAHSKYMEELMGDALSQRDRKASWISDGINE